MRIPKSLPHLARRALVSATTVVLAAGTLPVLAAGPASAGALADINNVSFKAADPATYDHTIGGGAWNDGSVTYVQGSLQGTDFACGDIVSYFFELNVADTPSIDDFPARMVVDFTADSTGQSGVSLTPTQALVNYGDVGGTGAGGSDAGMSDNGNSTVTNWGVTRTGTEFTSGAVATATFDVTHLEASENVIVRVDAQIGCDAYSTPTGNLQAALMSVDVIAPGTPHSINTGNQTVNFQTVGNIAGVGEPMLRIVTTASTNGSCPGSDPLSIDLSTNPTITYCYVVTNYGTEDATTATLTDDNATSGDATDDLSGTVPGGSYPAGQTTTITRTGKIFTAGSYEYTGSAGAGNATTATDPVTIVATGVAPTVPEPVLTKTVVAADGTCPGDTHTRSIDLKTATSVKYCYVVENIGNATLQDVTLVDDMGTPGDASDDVTVTLSGLTAGDLPVGDTATGEHVAEWTDAGSATAVATVSGTDGTDPYSDTDQTVVTITDTRTAGLSVEKTVSLDGNCPGVSAVTINRGTRSTVTFCYRVTNTGDLPIVDAQLVDDMGTPADPSDDIVIPLGDLDPTDVIDASLDGVPVPPEDGIYDSGVTLTGDSELGPYSDTAVVAVTVNSYELGAVAGIAFFDRNRDGIHQDGEPILAGVPVTITAGPCVTELTPCGGTETTITGEDGRYSFPYVPVGSYTVLGAVPNTPQSGVAEVLAGETAIVDMPVIGRSTISGKVTVEGSTTPIPYAPVVCTWVGLDGVAGTADDASFATVTNPLGEYHLMELPAGGFSCRFTDPVTGKTTIALTTAVDNAEAIANGALPRTASAALAATGGEAGMLVTGGFALTGIGTVLTRLARRRKRR